MPDSNSKAFARRLREAVENREALDTPEIRAAAAADPTSAALWERQAIVESAVEAMRAESVEIDLADRVLAAMAENPETADLSVTDPPSTFGGRSNGRRTLAAMLVAAAALLVVVFAMQGPGRQGEKAGDGPSIAESPVVPAPEPIVEEPPTVVADTAELEQLFARATTAYVGLARETRVAVADLGVLVPKTGVPVPPRPMDVPEPPAESPSWLDRGFAPVRDNVGRTLDFLLEPVPADSTAT